MTDTQWLLDLVEEADDLKRDLWMTECGPDLARLCVEQHEALERLRANAGHIFDKHPVRDWDETLAEANAALARFAELKP